MKKVLLGLLAVSAVSMAADINPTNVYLKAGVDSFSKVSVIKYEGENITKKHTKKFKYELGLEATQTITSNTEIGLGVVFQEHGRIKTTNGEIENDCFPQLRSFPVYLIGKYNIPVEGEYKPYVFANLGYSFNGGEATYEEKLNGETVKKIETEYKNGMYWGVGAGVEINNFVIDLSYKMNHGKIKYATNGVYEDGVYSENGSKKLNYGRVTLGFGYKFSF